MSAPRWWRVNPGRRPHRWLCRIGGHMWESYWMGKARRCSRCGMKDVLDRWEDLYPHEQATAVAVDR